MGWYNASWTKRKKITIDNTKISGASHTSFPVLISRTDADIKASAQADGDDILFTSADGTTKLDHELEEWDSGTGVLVAWVRVPTLSGTVDTDIYVYYGNPAATDQQNITGVWDSNYKGVWHLNDDFLDSTLNNNDGSNTGSLDIAGKIADGQDFDALDDNVNCGTGSSLDITGDLTLEAWLYPDGWGEGGFGRFIARSNGTSQGFEFLIWDDTLQFSGIPAAGNNVAGSLGSISLGAWQQAVATRISGTGKVYVDGVEKGSAAVGTINSYAGALLIGSNNGLTRSFDGKIDEVRVSNIGRSIDWLVTQHNNHNSPGTFYSVGVEEGLGSILDRIGGVLDRTASGVLVRVLGA